MSHANAPFTPEGRRRLCGRVEAGRPIAHVAAEAGISRQCLSKWYARWVEDGEDGLLDRSSQPQGSPRRTSPQVVARIKQLRTARRLHHRPHAALGELPPVSRVTNVPGCDN